MKKRVISLVIAIAFVLIIGISGCKSKPDVVGTWKDASADTILYYVYEDGTFTVALEQAYSFKWKLEGDYFIWYADGMGDLANIKYKVDGKNMYSEEGKLALVKVSDDIDEDKMPQSYTPSSTKKYSEDEIEELVIDAVKSSMHKNINSDDYNPSATKYTIGSVQKIEENKYVVRGKMNFYDYYGSLKKTVTFTSGEVWFNEERGGASMMGLGEIDWSYAVDW